MKGIRAALGLLTRLPVGRIQPVPLWTALWFWIPGFLAGLVWYGSARVFGMTGLGMVAAIAGEALLTGGVHWKGLANTFDGWMASPGRRTALRRDPRLSAGGVLFMALALLSFWGLWRQAGGVPPVTWILPPLFSRAMMAWGLSWRGVDSDSPQTAQWMLDTEGGTGSWVTLLISLLIGAYVAGFRAIDSFGGMLLLTGLFMLWARRLYRGMNEDVLYSAVIVAELLALYFLVASTPAIL